MNIRELFEVVDLVECIQWQWSQEYIDQWLKEFTVAAQTMNKSEKRFVKGYIKKSRIRYKELIDILN